MRNRFKALLVIVMIAAILVLPALALHLVGIDLGADALRGWIASNKHWAALAILGLMIAHCFLPFPIEILACIAGEVFGLFWGTVVCWIGAMLGAALSFVLSRRFGAVLAERVLPRSASQSFERWISERGEMAWLIVRFVPIVSFNLVNYAAGFAKLSWWSFFWTTGTGILPATVLFVYVGENMRGRGAWEWLLLVAGGLALYVAVKLIQRVWASYRRMGLSLHRSTALVEQPAFSADLRSN